MNRTGIVLEIKGNKAIIMTPNGEFVNISFRGKAPSIGEIYSGRISKYNNAIRHLAIVASITFILICVSAIKLYYTACASIIVSINPSIEITINRWDRIIKAIPLNDDGSKILSEIKINNKPLNNGLDKIITESKKQNFINDNYITSGRKINIDIYTEKKDKNIDLADFKKSLIKENLKYKIQIEEKTKATNHKFHNQNQYKPSKDNKGKNKDNSKSKDKPKNKSPKKDTIYNKKNGNGSQKTKEKNDKTPQENAGKIKASNNEEKSKATIPCESKLAKPDKHKVAIPDKHKINMPDNNKKGKPRNR